ncbi:hypothetical protein [Colwellia sp. MB3u-55]|jgi:hypothetical protein|uniref:hypothetical protein n=1 Tax=Colwellia sp. MB3u-55 TaxID=2759810 RepID=UPI0015F6DFEC|nr:hypothetical protein [Colwellia sp. MB3u-55]MBA6250797.1 hypothetical protein [Colwellia sp. MB3u-55]
MSEKEIKKIVRKYRLRANYFLAAILLILVAVDWKMTDHFINKYAELGLPLPISDIGGESLYYIFIPFAVFHSCVYVFEKAIIDINKYKSS